MHNSFSYSQFTELKVKKRLALTRFFDSIAQSL